VVTAAFALVDGGWVACWALVAVGTALYGPTRYALLPAASEDSHVPLTRINGWIEMGAVTAIVGGLYLGYQLHLDRWQGMEAAVAAAAGLNLLSLLLALPVRFRADVRRPERPGQAIAGFFRDTRRILGDREARGFLLALACLRGLVAGLTGAIIAAWLAGHGGGVQELIKIAAWLMAGIAAGSLLAGVQRHPRRALGLVPPGMTGLVIGMVIAAAGQVPSPVLCMLLGAMGGLINVPLAAAYQASLPADARGNGMAVRNFADYVLMTLVSAALFGLARSGRLDAAGQLWLLALLGTAGMLVSWWALYINTLEQVLEFILWPLYRIHARGPSADAIPQRGPLLVLANHSAWMDPFWLGKVVPRRIVPMMTSLFYDLPVLSFLMRHVVQAIRVQAANYRREVPELDEAIAALDRGLCVVVFPEGSMRRKEAVELRQFGQGVWHILRARPQTPVVVCWIEGGWGSYCSYRHGPPTKNKRLDFWRRIDIAVNEPLLLDAALLEDQRATRSYLMQQCLEARRLLGLESLQPEKMEHEEEPGDMPQGRPTTESA
jgi:1-acyl-sn-glycerol-3-phosphate acyltransferase